MRIAGHFVYQPLIHMAWCGASSSTRGAGRPRLPSSARAGKTRFVLSRSKGRNGANKRTLAYFRATSTLTAPALSCFATNFTTPPLGAFLPTLTTHSIFTRSAVGVVSVQNDIRVCL